MNNGGLFDLTCFFSDVKSTANWKFATLVAEVRPSRILAFHCWQDEIIDQPGPLTR